MRCLYCGKHLALFKKLTGGGEFCSDAHKQSYHEEYNKLALNRLMEAQTRQEDQSTPQPAARGGSGSPPGKPELVEPTARGGYFKQSVPARNPGMAMLASPAQGPAGWPIGFPCAAELRFSPEPGQAGVIMEHRGVPGATAAMAPVSDFLRMCPDPGCAFPRHHFEIDTLRAPAATGPVGFDTCPAPPSEPELRHESAAGFRLSWELPESLDPDWVDGLEFASSEQRLAAVPLGSPREPASSEELAQNRASAAGTGVPLRMEASPGAPGAPEDPGAATVPEREPAAAPVAPVEPAWAAPLLASATPEPVIDEALLLSLFGGDDEAAPLPAAASVPVVQEAPAAAIREITQPQAAPGIPTADTAAGPVPPHEPISFLPVVIRPAAAPNKPRLMQSFQAIAMVSANPQIPVWNMLPLRPRMALGRPPGPGASLLDRGKPEAGAPSGERKPRSAAVDAANEPESPEELFVPTFGSATKPRAGLSRWFKLSILAGVLGIASGSFRLPCGAPVGVAAAVSNPAVELAAGGWVERFQAFSLERAKT